MPEKIEIAEMAEGKLEPVEKVENIGKRLDLSIEALKGERGLSAAEAFDGFARGLSRWVGERAEDVGRIAEYLAGKVEGSALGNTEFGKQLLGGLEMVTRLAEKGAEFMKKEEVAAFIALGALAAFAIAQPEAALALVRDNPELISNNLQALGFFG